MKAEGVLHPDLYQLLAYTIVADLPGGLLIYAAGEDVPVVHEIVNIGNRLEVVTLDLAGIPAEVLGQVRGVALRVSGIAAAPARLPSAISHPRSAAD